MKQVYLSARGPLPVELRSDTLFGLLMWGLREVYGREELLRLLKPLEQDPPGCPLLVTSAFPYHETGAGRVHWFPRPCTLAAERGGAWIEERELLAFVSGRDLPECPAGPGAPRGLFFLAHGVAEALLEGALLFLERFGFGGAAFDVELREAEFLRAARAGESGLLLSLYHPTATERGAIQAAAADANGTAGVAYRVERRAGVTGGGLIDPERRWQQPLAMLSEGAVLPVTRETCGSAPVVGDAHDGVAPFSVRRNGFAFFIPITGGAP